ncbi:hypothetical protein [Hoyosella subflava]|uniref:Uncharacterized protein n=1 Tax=Hoyosella subflava (strain DSM 45089 / JCM 17490 / NBRC 109087 / DQS3-9A1) TaxID=443218 RepID=F6ESA0_HOYSD|nr:hypothetical protein [Hoyosella subflava]AEF43021.1 hypothetical protein AS9A_P10004 [Hoyosella subflava DQS3-9A1]
MAARFGLTTGHHSGADGYVLNAHVDALVDAYGLVPDFAGEVVLRVVSGPFPPLDRGVAPIAVVATDLMDSLTTRERRAGTRVLQKLLDALS